MRVSPIFTRATACALRAASVTGGDLDPTVATSLRAAGYDRDIAALRSGGVVRFRRPAGWLQVEFDEANSIVRLEPGVQLDFGATAKALAADLAAEAVATEIDRGVLVSIGGDIAIAGDAPSDGWPVCATDNHAVVDVVAGQTVALRAGGLATSSTTVRRWQRAGAELHHILDPTTGAPVREYWRTASVAAACCVDANIASTTAIIRGQAAPAWLETLGLPSRLVRVDGTVTLVAGWPAQERVPS
jgi:thiamine biosynthesis lipoprotein